MNSLYHMGSSLFGGPAEHKATEKDHRRPFPPIPIASVEVTTDDLKWVMEPATATEAQTFYITLDEGNAFAFIQVVYSTLGWSPTVQITGRVYFPDAANNVAKTSSVDGTTFHVSEDKLSVDCEHIHIKFHPDDFSYDVTLDYGSDLQADLKFKPVVKMYKVNDGKVHFMPDPTHGYIAAQFMPKAQVTGSMTVHGKKMDAKGEGLYLHAVQFKPQCVGKWNFVNFQSKDSAIVLYEFEMPADMGYTLDIVCQGSLVHKGKLVSVLTDNRSVHVRKLYDAFSGYEIPTEIALSWRGRTTDGTDQDVKIDMNLVPKNQVAKIDVLSELPFVLRKFIQTFVTAPFVYQWFETTSAKVTIGDESFEIEGKVFMECSFMMSMTSTACPTAQPPALTKMTDLMLKKDKKKEKKEKKLKAEAAAAAANGGDDVEMKDVEVKSKSDDGAPAEEKKKKKKDKKRKDKKDKVDDAATESAAASVSEDVAVSEKKEKKRKHEDDQASKSTNGNSNGESSAMTDKTKKKKKKLVGDSSASMKSMVEDAVAKTSSSKGAVWSYTESKELSNLPQSKIDDFLKSNSITLENAADCGRPILEFKQAGFPADLENALSQYPKPTFIQSVTWPPILKGRDLIGIAATGSGKTIAFGIPALLYIKNRLATANVSGNPKHRVQALIMAPTRELAVQIQKEMDKFAPFAGVTTICLYGGMPKHEQKKGLRAGPDVVIATPGRLIDFIHEGECDVSDVGFFVLDEADRMLDLGFEPNIKEIAAAIKKKERQTVMFSATWPQSVVKLSQQYLANPVHVTVGSTDLTANINITQHVEVIDPKDKNTRLLALLRDYHKSRKNRVMVFALYKNEAARLEQFLVRQGYNARSIHGDLSQDKRTEAINKFRDGSCPLLIATDVAARGIDVPDVEYVINYTYPLTTEDYCHRIGRTGRAGKKGIAHTMFTVHDKAHSGSLINVLKQANQAVPEDLMKFGTTVKKKVDANYGAFVKEIDPNAKATKITFDDDSD
ncbi:RNA-dependent ATPase [Chytridiales sp. JEL 0842]|nr:RNA-dependent ATPase [Chytridiales sp. JEL 0842]